MACRRRSRAVLGATWREHTGKFAPALVAAAAARLAHDDSSAPSAAHLSSAAAASGSFLQYLELTGAGPRLAARTTSSVLTRLPVGVAVALGTSVRTSRPRLVSWGERRWGRSGWAAKIGEIVQEAAGDLRADGRSWVCEARIARSSSSGPAPLRTWPRAPARIAANTEES